MYYAIYRSSHDLKYRQPAAACSRPVSADLETASGWSTAMTRAARLPCQRPGAAADAGRTFTGKRTTIVVPFASGFGFVRAGSREAGQCRKWRRPVATIAMPAASAAAMTSSSRTEPPGWMIAATPASIASCGPSANGK